MHLIQYLAELVNPDPDLLFEVLEFNHVGPNLGDFVFQILLQRLYLRVQHFSVVFHLHGALEMLGLCLLCLPHGVLNVLSDCINVHRVLLCLLLLSVRHSFFN
jgi:hypothetical protein